MSVIVTYSGPVLPYEPQVVAEEGQDADAEHGRHKEKEQDVEFGVSVWQLVLGGNDRRGGERESKSLTHSLGGYLWKDREIRETEKKAE